MKTQSQIQRELSKVQILLFADKVRCASGLYGAQQALAWVLGELCGMPGTVAKRGTLYSPKDSSNASAHRPGDKPQT